VVIDGVVHDGLAATQWKVVTGHGRMVIEVVRKATRTAEADQVGYLQSSLKKPRGSVLSKRRTSGPLLKRPPLYADYAHERS
jgi:hypothetical protein